MRITDRKVDEVTNYRRWPFADLQKGQCLEHECESKEELKAFRSAAYYAKRRYGFQITVRNIEGTLYGAFRTA